MVSFKQWNMDALFSMSSLVSLKKADGSTIIAIVVDSNGMKIEKPIDQGTAELSSAFGFSADGDNTTLDNILRVIRGVYFKSTLLRISGNGVYLRSDYLILNNDLSLGFDFNFRIQCRW